MSNSSDLEILDTLAELNEIVNNAIDKANNLLQEAWDREDIGQIKAEIDKARQELQQANIFLKESQNSSTQIIQEINAISSSASEQKNLLEQTYNASVNLYSDLKSETETGRDCLNSLATSIEQSEQYKTQFNEAVRRIETAENILSEINSQYDLLLEVWNSLTEINNSVGSYDSIKDLAISIREATKKLQQERELIKTAIAEQIEPLKHRIDMLNDSIISLQKDNQKLQQEQRFTRNAIDEQIEPLKRQIDRLIQAQSTPWWLPRNWWWKKRISFTAKPFKQPKK